VQIRNGLRVFNITLPVQQFCLDIIRNRLASSHLSEFTLYTESVDLMKSKVEVEREDQFQFYFQHALRLKQTLKLTLEEDKPKILVKRKRNDYQLIEPRKRQRTEVSNPFEIPKKKKKKKKKKNKVSTQAFIPEILPEFEVPIVENRVPEIRVAEIRVPEVRQPETRSVEIPDPVQEVQKSPPKSDPVSLPTLEVEKEEMPAESQDDETCHICKMYWVKDRWHLDTDWLCCDKCGKWYHVYCLGMDNNEFKRIVDENTGFVCTSCK